jgi:hypothetical protein
MVQSLVMDLCLWYLLDADLVNCGRTCAQLGLRGFFHIPAWNYEEGVHGLSM